MTKFGVREFVTDFLLLWLGIALGILVGGFPLVFTAQTEDPFDKASSYLIWLAGMFLSTMFISLFRPDRVWRWGIAVGFGFPTAVILGFIAEPEAYQVLPVTIIFSVIVGVPPALAGAYLGRLVDRKKSET